MAARWIAKALIQKGISFLPYPERINLLFQRYVSKGLQLDDVHFGYKITAARDHIIHWKKHGKNSRPIQILELGTGWYPVVPIAMFLCEIGQVKSFDIYRWMNVDSQLVAINKFKEWYEKGELLDYLPGFSVSRWNKLIAISKNSDVTKEDIDELLGLETLVQDARQSDLANDSIDLICSNNTFEHVHVEVLEGLMKEFYRVLSPGGLMSHFIDLSDHFAHMDGRINIFNFLRFSPRQWKLIDNDIQPQNRLRWPNYREMHDKLQLKYEEAELRRGSESDLKKIPVHQSFLKYTESDIRITHGYLISWKS